jgi:hypothetical protein
MRKLVEYILEAATLQVLFHKRVFIAQLQSKVIGLNLGQVPVHGLIFYYCIFTGIGQNMHYGLYYDFQSNFLVKGAQGAVDVTCPRSNMRKR